MRTYDEYLLLPRIWLSDLVRRRNASRAECISQAGDRWLVVYFFPDGRQERQTTAPCRLCTAEGGSQQ